jgi:hypothetical protein
MMNLRNGLAAAILAIGVVLAPTVANASCSIFEHRDYGGASFTLNDMERLVMVNGENLGCTTNGYGGSCERTIYKAAWNDHVSSFRVTEGCTITMWEHINEGGARWRSSKSFVYVGDSWNDEVSEVFCSCPSRGWVGRATLRPTGNA